MNKHLAKALKELEVAKAEGVRNAEEILNAKDGTEWWGKISTGGDWKLIKNSSDSYTTNTRKQT